MGQTCKGNWKEQQENSGTEELNFQFKISNLKCAHYDAQRPLSIQSTDQVSTYAFSRLSTLQEHSPLFSNLQIFAYYGEYEFMEKQESLIEPP